MDKEMVKLLNVLRRIGRAAIYAAWVKPQPDVAHFCNQQYNKVLARLSKLKPAIKPLFNTLPTDASPQVTRMAARQLLAYFEGDQPERCALEIAAGQRRFTTNCLPPRWNF
jgi:hypothetical protein